MPQWHVISVDDSDVAVASFDDVGDAVERLRVLEQSAAAVRPFIFYGERVPISKPPYRYLLVPDGPPVPLFDAPAALDPDDDPVVGGREPDYKALTAALAVAYAPAAAAGDRDDGADDEQPLD